jgi:hypothetical protein
MIRVCMVARTSATRGPSRIPEQLGHDEQGEQRGRPYQQHQSGYERPFENAESQCGDAFFLPIRSG